MLYNNSIEKLINLQGVIVKNIENTEKEIVISIELKRKVHHCPSCSAETDKIHDYRKQTIKDISILGKNVYYILRKRRYSCHCCGKKFAEENTFLPKYYRMTQRLIAFVIESLKNEHSFTSISKVVNLSVNTVIRIFDLVSYSNKKLPRVLSIDEFKGNTGNEKYQCILTDPENNVVLDILPKRHNNYLISYFKPYKDREKVEIFISDMWKPYTDIASTFLKNSMQVIDKYHWIRGIVWAFESVRKEEQKKLSKQDRIYFKRSRSRLIKRFEFLPDYDKQAVNIMLYKSIKLSSAHFLKEEFFKILDTKDKFIAKKLLSDWILMAQSSAIPSFEKYANTLINWSYSILNSFDTKYTNGFTEGCNNKIKVLKRNAYGYRNFHRFRNRILHMFSHQKNQHRLPI